MKHSYEYYRDLLAAAAIQYELELMIFSLPGVKAIVAADTKAILISRSLIPDILRTRNLYDGIKPNIPPGGLTAPSDDHDATLAGVKTYFDTVQDPLPDRTIWVIGNCTTQYTMEITALGPEIWTIDNGKVENE